jgi:hypothetical protein
MQIVPVLGLIAGLVLLFVDPEWFVGQHTVGLIVTIAFAAFLAIQTFISIYVLNKVKKRMGSRGFF